MEVFTIPIGTKKSRPGILLTVLCREEDQDQFVHLIFKHTTTLGIREKRCNRHTLERKTEIVNTPYGQVRRKVSSGYGISRSKYEYEDLAQIAKKAEQSLAQVTENIPHPGL